MDAEVQTLLSLKKQYKEATGKDWTPPKPGDAAAKEGGKGAKAMPAVGGKAEVNSAEALAVKAEVDAQGDKVRQLKAGGGAKVRLGMIVEHAVI